MSDPNAATVGQSPDCNRYEPAFWHYWVLETDAVEPPADALEHLGQCPPCQKLVNRLLHDSFEALKGGRHGLAPPATTEAASSHHEESIERLKTKLENEIRSPSHTTAPPPEKLGRYTVIRPLGRGGMNQVYLCQDDLLARQVAIKLFPEVGHDPHRRDRMNREAKLQASISHPNIVRLLEVNTDSETPYIVMELMQGPSLKELKQAGPVPPQRAAAYMETIARAVHHAHEQGVLHRDLKPSNILIEKPISPEIPFPKDLTLKVADFGLARSLGTTSDLTAPNMLVGTPAYMSPEQTQGNHSLLGPASDIYALGAILYDLLVGRAPIIADDLRLTLAMIRETQPISPRVFQPNLSKDLGTICLKCLEKSPFSRYESALQLADDLRRYQEKQPIKARPVSDLAKAWRWCQRNPRQAFSYLLALVSMFGLVIATTIFVVKQKRLKEVNDSSLSTAKAIAIDTIKNQQILAEEQGRVEMDYYHSIRNMHSQFQNLLKTSPPGQVYDRIQKNYNENVSHWIPELKRLQLRVEDDFNKPENDILICSFLASLLQETGQKQDAAFWSVRVMQAALNYPGEQKAEAETVQAIFTATLLAAANTADPARLAQAQKILQQWPPDRMPPNAPDDLKQLRQKLAAEINLHPAR